MPDTSLQDAFIKYLSHPTPRTPAGRIAQSFLLWLKALLVVGLIGLVILGVIQSGLQSPEPPVYLEASPAAAIVLGVVVLLYLKRRTEYKRLRKAVPVWATIVMANKAIFEPGKGDIWPALVLVTFDESLNEDPPLMAAVVQRLFMIRSSNTAPTELKQNVGAILKERPISQEGHRCRLPEEVIEGVEVYAVDLFIHRKYLKEGYLTPESGRLLCLIEPGDQGAIWHLPHELSERRAFS